MKKTDLIHIFIYLMIFIILSNWYINYIIIPIISIIFVITFGIMIKLIFENKKLKKEKII